MQDADRRVIAPSARRKVESGRLRILPFPEITAKIERGEYQKHAFPKGFVITQVMQYEREKVLEVVLLVGERWEEWKSGCVAHLRMYAKEHGCTAIEALSRCGLRVSLKDLGFKTKKVLLRLEV
jgi:hypothetical protein